MAAIMTKVPAPHGDYLDLSIPEYVCLARTVQLQRAADIAGELSELGHRKYCEHDIRNMLTAARRKLGHPTSREMRQAYLRAYAPELYCEGG